MASAAVMNPFLGKSSDCTFPPMLATCPSIFISFSRNDAAKESMNAHSQLNSFEVKESMKESMKGTGDAAYPPISPAALTNPFSKINVVCPLPVAGLLKHYSSWKTSKKDCVNKPKRNSITATPPSMTSATPLISSFMLPSKTAKTSSGSTTSVKYDTFFVWETDYQHVGIAGHQEIYTINYH